MLGQHNALVKAIKSLAGNLPGDNSSSEEHELRKRNKSRCSPSSGGMTKHSGSNGGTAKAPCFLCGSCGHLSFDCYATPENWVAVDSLSADLQSFALAVRGMIKKEPNAI